METILNDFKLNRKVPGEVLEKYKNLVPKEVIDLWQEYGLGTFMSGYFKVIDPEDFIDILQVSSQRYKDAVVLFATAMGDLVLWADGYIRVLNFRYGVLTTVMPSLLLFLKSLHSDKFREDYLKWQPYPKAVESLGELSYEECFGYTPLLGLGGAEKVGNLEKVKLKEHILIITDLRDQLNND